MDEGSDDDRPVTRKEFKKDLEIFIAEMRAMFAEQRTGQVLTGPIVPASDLTGSEEGRVYNHHWTVAVLRKHKGSCCSSVVKVVLRSARVKFE